MTVGLLFASAMIAAKPPNVLLICVDDLKPALGCYGDKLAKSPNIDKLAARGLRFERAYCNQAVCSPSRNALLAGLRPQTLGIYDLPTNFRRSVPDAITLPQFFKSRGYHSAGLGKIFHVGHGNTEDPRSWSVPHFRAKSINYALKDNAALTKEGALFENRDPANLPKGAAYENADVADDVYGDGKLADEAIRRIADFKSKPTEPFFLAVGFLKPHLPFCAPKKYWDMYDPAKFELAKVVEPPAGAPSYAPQFGGELRNYKDMPAKGAIPNDEQRKLIHGYYASLSYMDAQVGKVLGALDAAGLADNTIVVLWGDHGWHLGDHGMWCKHTNYEQATRIPLIVSAPGVTRPGTHTEALVESVDLYPTLADLAGLQVSSGLDGTSLKPILQDPSAKVRDAAIHVYPRGDRLGRALRTATHRLVEWKRFGASEAEYELYDYVADAAETKNLAAENPDLVKSLAAELAKHPPAKPPVRNSAPANAASKKKAGGKQDRNALFARKDADGDGKLTKDEFLANQPDPDKAPARFKTFDANGDGVLSKDEFVNMGKKP